MEEKIKRAVEVTSRATELDRKKEYREALGVYEEALHQWIHICKFDTNALRQEKLRPQIEEYMRRVEEIRNYLASIPSTAVAGVLPSASSNELSAQLESAIIREKPNVHWEDVAGLEKAKQTLQESVILPVKFPQMFTESRRPWKGILLYGPPGTGKSFLAKACATEAEAKFFSISASSLLSKWLGESERLVKQLFEMARAEKRSIIFIDEVDSLCGARGEGESEASRRVKTEFLVQMDGVGTQGGQVLVLGATNCPWDLDPAIRRRFERRIYIPLPEQDARRHMIKKCIGKTKTTLIASDYEELARRTDGFSGADMSVLVRDALLQPIRRFAAAQYFKKEGNFYVPCEATQQGAEKRSLMTIPAEEIETPPVAMVDFTAALENVRASVGTEDLKRQEDWTKMYGMEG